MLLRGLTMKRTPMKPGRKPLQRAVPMRASTTPLNRAGTATLRARNRETTLRKQPLKARGPTMTPIRRAARGEECTLRFPGICNRDPATSVWCHSNRYEHGKGLGLKSNDEHGCVGCSACHAFYDGGYANVAGWTRAAVEARFDQAEALSRPILRAKGALGPVGE
jgi:hypothetical protein